METRNLYFDNMKFILIFLVVLGHFANLHRLLPIMGGLNNVIYSFHMPLFIYISGYFSRNVVQPRRTGIDKILFIYVVFEVLNFLFTKFTSLGYGSSNLFEPTYQNWYILGIFFWRLLAPCFNFYPRKITIIGVIALSIIIGFYKDFNTFLALYRIIYFMPFFVLGYYSDNFFSFKQKFQKYTLIFTPLLILALSAIYILSVYIPNCNSFLSDAYTPIYGYNIYDQNKIHVFLIRMFGLFSSSIISFLVLFIIPEYKTIFSHLGGRTMNVFLLHMFLVFPVNALFNELKLNNLMVFIFSIITSIIITYFLSLKFIEPIVKPFTSFEHLQSFLSKNPK